MITDKHTELRERLLAALQDEVFAQAFYRFCPDDLAAIENVLEMFEYELELEKSIDNCDWCGAKRELMRHVDATSFESHVCRTCYAVEQSERR